MMSLRPNAVPPAGSWNQSASLAGEVGNRNCCGAKKVLEKAIVHGGEGLVGYVEPEHRRVPYSNARKGKEGGFMFIWLWWLKFESCEVIDSNPHQNGQDETNTKENDWRAMQEDLFEISDDKENDWQALSEGSFEIVDYKCSSRCSGSYEGLRK